MVDQGCGLMMEDFGKCQNNFHSQRYAKEKRHDSLVSTLLY